MIKHRLIPFTPHQQDVIAREIAENAPYDTSLRRLSMRSKNVLFGLATSRNRNLITKGEQQQLATSVVGFFGLSVGSHAALTWMMESRASVVKISDPDIVTPTNLNRIRFGWESVGKRKIDIVEKSILSMCPFTRVIKRATSKIQEIDRLFTAAPSLHAVVDEMDSLEAKVRLRILAKKHNIPLVSATDIGDNVALDIERYDTNPQPAMFLGRIDPEEIEHAGKLRQQERRAFITKIVGTDHHSEAMLGSLRSIGSSIMTWPQLGATATISGGLVVTAIKKIFLGEKVTSGRYYVSLDKLLVSDFKSPPG